MKSFLINNNQFLLNGQPIKLISGALHYFRVVPEYWRDRLEKLRAMGCNTVETYIPWNIHEPRKGQFCFDGMADVERFIHLAADMGLLVILRPGPYICAEWEFGGLPAWLLSEDGMRVRSIHPAFMQHLRDYFQVLFTRLVPHQITKGGPVILFQVENEYGYYGDCDAYMSAVRDLMIELGVDVPLITSDGPNGDALSCGSVHGALPTANFGSRAQQQCEKLRRFLDAEKGGGPEMVTEFWIGWFDYWGNGGHSTASAVDNAQNLDIILERGDVNFYMFHGGTNFGFMNGSNNYDQLMPDVTSYDYDAPLSEDGQITAKYLALREVISRYTYVPEMKFSMEIKRKSYGEVRLAEKTSLFSVLEDITVPVSSPWPLCMEKLGQNYGYVLYRSSIIISHQIEKIRLYKANDRAIVFLDGEKKLTLYDRALVEEHAVEWKMTNNATLSILCENMGRVNYGFLLNDQRKGIDGEVLLNGHTHSGWDCYPLELDHDMIAKVDYSKPWHENTPGFYKFIFVVEELADTFLDMGGWGKGCVFINGFHLGRFWEIGPQQRLYLPAPLLRQGVNEIVVFETEGKTMSYITFCDQPALDLP